MDLSIATLLDFTVLAFLAGTVFYALRLSGQLKILQDSKHELEQLVSNLAINITRAHEAIQEMHEVASTSSETLQDRIRTAQDLSHELQLMTESGDNIADRLETLATSKTAPPQEKRRTAPPRPPVKSVEHFFIRDRDFDEEENTNDETPIEDAFDNLSSRAEKQLASALRRSRGFDA